MSRWADLTGGDAGAGYAARFAELAATGKDMHGEARLCAALVPAPARVLDAGCGTGRVAAWLAAHGYETVGIDLDPSMLAEARRAAPHLTWLQADLADLDVPAVLSPTGSPEGFDLVVAAGNVIPLLAGGTEAEAVRRLASVLKPGGMLVAGFGLDAAHLPVPPSVTLDDYDTWCAAAGLTLDHRLSTWDGRPYTGDGYAVTIHLRPI
ncbi:class I SAM-dependent methyltransferase [Nonomuraea sp. NPDC046570]|uniref:class I SAM-dependent methyltransferase n=1 Tax=Nonomuraea sp. NPDC046570 TaxID=3155255 RepID=UPI0033DA595A